MTVEPSLFSTPKADPISYPNSISPTRTLLRKFLSTPTRPHLPSRPSGSRPPGRPHHLSLQLPPGPPDLLDFLPSPTPIPCRLFLAHPEPNQTLPPPRHERRRVTTLRTKRPSRISPNRRLPPPPFICTTPTKTLSTFRRTATARATVLDLDAFPSREDRPVRVFLSLHSRMGRRADLFPNSDEITVFPSQTPLPSIIILPLTSAFDSSPPGTPAETDDLTGIGKLWARGKSMTLRRKRSEDGLRSEGESDASRRSRRRPRRGEVEAAAEAVNASPEAPPPDVDIGASPRNPSFGSFLSPTEWDGARRRTSSTPARVSISQPFGADAQAPYTEFRGPPSPPLPTSFSPFKTFVERVRKLSSSRSRSRERERRRRTVSTPTPPIPLQLSSPHPSVRPRTRPTLNQGIFDPPNVPPVGILSSRRPALTRQRSAPALKELHIVAEARYVPFGRELKSRVTNLIASFSSFRSRPSLRSPSASFASLSSSRSHRHRNTTSPVLSLGSFIPSRGPPSPPSLRRRSGSSTINGPNSVDRHGDASGPPTPSLRSSSSTSTSPPISPSFLHAIFPPSRSQTPAPPLPDLRPRPPQLSIDPTTFELVPGDLPPSENEESIGQFGLSRRRTASTIVPLFWQKLKPAEPDPPSPTRRRFSPNFDLDDRLSFAAVPPDVPDEMLSEASHPDDSTETLAPQRWGEFGGPPSIGTGIYPFYPGSRRTRSTSSLGSSLTARSLLDVDDGSSFSNLVRTAALTVPSRSFLLTFAGAPPFFLGWGLLVFPRAFEDVSD